MEKTLNLILAEQKRQGDLLHQILNTVAATNVKVDDLNGKLVEMGRKLVEMDGKVVELHRKIVEMDGRITETNEKVKRKSDYN